MRQKCPIKIEPQDFVNDSSTQMGTEGFILQFKVHAISSFMFNYIMDSSFLTLFSKCLISIEIFIQDS